MKTQIDFADALMAERAQMVYSLATGAYNLEMVHLPLQDVVRNEYLAGLPAANLTNRVYAARERLNVRYGVPMEDEDITALTEAYEALMAMLCKKMYLYGAALESPQ